MTSVDMGAKKKAEMLKAESGNWEFGRVARTDRRVACATHGKDGAQRSDAPYLRLVAGGEGLAGFAERGGQRGKAESGNADRLKWDVGRVGCDR